MDIQRLQVTHPSYTDVPKRWLAFEEIARVLTDEEVAFTSQHNCSRLCFYLHSFKAVSVGI